MPLYADDKFVQQVGLKYTSYEQRNLDFFQIS